MASPIMQALDISVFTRLTPSTTRFVLEGEIYAIMDVGERCSSQAMF
jgi:hypothetical protein